MATLSPYVGLSVDTGVTLDPAGLTVGDGGLTLEPQTVVKFALLPGSGGDTFTTPDAAANDFLGDIDFQFDLVLDTWGTGSEFMVKKGNAGDGFGYEFLVTQLTELQLSAQTQGQGGLNVFARSTVRTNFVNGSRHWVRVTRVANTGVVTFFTSEDGIIFTQLGTPITDDAGVLSNTSTVVTFGQSMTGRIYRGLLKSVIDGTIAVDFNPNDYEEGLTFTSSTTDEEWTLNGNVSIEEE